ncbi:uncharacterized protein (DUF885 family) [Sphingomonas kaistensis]|uniref:Uncharacterized protein (DUF885 family) n=1 Tax=Sphingomonas kaistensis TaxID=298708 RepID=A0A7X5Y3N9_9SPHN|nr:DUF885 domain-containing protein [Sphingomonas kaistensis]NJC04576.1 uncharacterized protein (DUF885 family) [Sphingomonas kaistensis]
MTRRFLLLGASLLALGACTATAPLTVVDAPPVASRPAATAQSEHERLFAIFKESDEASLRRNPLSALLRGDMRYADRLGDNISDAYFAGEKAAAERDLAALGTIDRARLTPTDAIAFDVFKFTSEDTLRGYGADLLPLTRVRPMNHFFGFHTFYPTFASGQGAAPFQTLVDYENNLKRHKDYVRYLDGAILRWREGMASGVVDTKLTVRNMIEQLDGQLKQTPAENSYLGPVRKFPESIPVEERARLTTAYRAAYDGEIRPALTRVRDFLRTEYLPAARDGVGLLSMKGGPELYRHLVRSSTTLDIAPEEIHQLGLSEVARIRGEMDKVRREVGFKGDLAAFFEHLRTDPKFQPKSRQALTDAYYAVGKKVDAELPRFFSTMPKARLEIRPYEPFREKFEAGGSYESGTPDGSRPGVFYFNAYDLPSRTTPGINTLYLHEGSPGHHFQISLAQENEALPSFMRFGGNTAYAEGWALYAETLGYDMGLFKDPYQRFGTLSDEMLRAMRLVVDTGLHAKGWSRDQAIAYMLANSNMGRTDATAEVERYIAIPGQALAYKLGSLTIQRLRAKAQGELGDRFDIRAFHDHVLNTGALPLAVLEQKIDRWIAVTKAG